MKCGDKSVKLKQFLRQINFGESQWVADETNLEVVETELASFHHISTPVVFNTKPSEQVLTLIFAFIKMIIHHHFKFHPSLPGDDGESLFASDGSRIWTQPCIAYFIALYHIALHCIILHCIVL